MTKLPAFLFAIIMSIAVHNTSAQSFTFAIASPAVSQVCDSNLAVVVNYYSSTFEISKIYAVTEGYVDTLGYRTNNGTYSEFNGVINLSGLVQNRTYKLKVTCRDVLGNEKSDSINYVYIKAPEATIIYPERIHGHPFI
jgi:hypothetical protein